MIGNGSAWHAKVFADDHHLGDLPLVTDPSLRTYRALEFTRPLLGFKPAIHALRAVAKGHRQGLTRGDARQLGGVLVVRKGGEVAWKFASEEAGHHPDIDAILGVLRGDGPTA